MLVRGRPEGVRARAGRDDRKHTEQHGEIPNRDGQGTRGQQAWESIDLRVIRQVSSAVPLRSIREGRSLGGREGMGCGGTFS